MLQDYRQISSPLCRVIKAVKEKEKGPDAHWAEPGPVQERIGAFKGGGTAALVPYLRDQDRRQSL